MKKKSGIHGISKNICLICFYRWYSIKLTKQRNANSNDIVQAVFNFLSKANKSHNVATLNGILKNY